jgi:hypothetical protein
MFELWMEAERRDRARRRSDQRTGARRPARIIDHQARRAAQPR